MTKNREEERSSARALLFDECGRLVLLRRTRPGQSSYLTTPGGGMLPGESVGQAVARECAEELGAVVTVGSVVPVDRTAEPTRSLQTFVLARLERFDARLRTGHELSEPARGDFATVHVNWRNPAHVATLRPEELRTVILERGAELAREAAQLPSKRPT